LQREHERKQKVPGFVELSTVSDITFSKAAEKIKDIRAKMCQQRNEFEEVKIQLSSIRAG